MKKIAKFIKENIAFVICAAALIFLLLPFYRHGQMIAGGEGSYFFDFLLVLKNYGYSWSSYGTGFIQPSISFGFVPYLIFLQALIKNERLVNFMMIFLTYFLPLLATYWLALELGAKRYIALFVSIFYVVNPFMANFLKFINHWNVLAAYILPSFFLIIYKFFDNNKKLFFFFGLNSLFFSFCNTNPPLMVIYQIALPLFVFFILIYKKRKFKIGTFIKKYFFVLSTFVLFNFWWIFNWFYIFKDAGRGYTKQFAISWLRGLGKFVPAFWKTFNLTVNLGHPIDPSGDYFGSYYTRFYSPLFLSIPALIILYFLIRKGINKKSYLVLFLGLFTVGFLTKGVKSLFGGIYELMVMKIPFFSIFKSAEEKWGILFIFLLTMVLIFILKELKKDRIDRLIMFLFFGYVGYCLVPFTAGKFIPDYEFEHDLPLIGSRKFINKIEYQNLRTKLNNDPGQYRVLSLPGSWNYQVALQIEGNRFYTGNDPVLSNINKPFLASYVGSWIQTFGVLFDKISHPDYLKILGLYNLKKVVVNKDMYPWFGFRQKEDIVELEEIFDQKLAGEKNEAIDFYDVGDNFLPRFYVPTQVIYSPESTQYELPELVSFGNISKRPALFISPYEKIKEGDKFTNDLVKEASNQVILVGELQSAIDEGKLRAGVRGMNPGGVLFPYARWKPGGFVYPHILKKEEKTKNQFFNQPEELLRQNLFFAGKRIFEIQRWDKELNDKEFSAVLKRYEEEMNGAIENSEKIRMTGKDTFWLLAEIEVSFEAFKERLLDVVGGDFGKQSQRFKLAEEATGTIDKRLKSVLKNYFQARYYFTVPEEGEYEVLLENKEGIFDWKIENIISEEEEKFILGIAGEQKEKAWLSFGKQKFNIGEYVLVLNQTPTGNLLNKKWNILESNVETGEVTRLFSKRNTPTAWQEIKNWEPETGYKLSFKYKTLVGRLKLSLIEEKERIDTVWFDKGVLDELPDKTSALLEDELISESPSEWEEYNIVVYSGRNAKKAKLFIYSESEKEKLSELEFKEATLTKIIEPKMILRKNRSENYFRIPQITFQKINPTKYILEIANANQPYFLVFSESFHRGWKAYINKTQNSKLKTQNYNGEIVASYFGGGINEVKEESGWFDKKFYETWRKEPLPGDRHLLMNGYANSWYITPADADFNQNYQVIIEYWPQRLFYLGVGVTLITIIGSLGFGLLRHAKKS